ncbi:MAG: lytic transglycosylase [Deltaproteobacteria bacterium]|nr:MAG: lytic transglycosylase [Deltaproteobacteria bacterium]
MDTTVDRAKFILALVVIACLVFASAVSWAEIYGYQDKEGRWHFPDTKIARRAFRGSREPLQDRDLYLASYVPLIHSVSKKYGVEEALVKAVVMAESLYDRTAVSSKGAIGLMQLMPETARRLKVKNPFSPRDNLEGGVCYLKELLARFDNDIVLAVAAYNAGPRKVEACGGVPPIAETKRFVRKVLYYYYQFKYARNP